MSLPAKSLRPQHIAWYNQTAIFLLVASSPLLLYRLPISGVPITINRLFLVLSILLLIPILKTRKAPLLSTLPVILITLHGVFLILVFGVFKGISGQLMLLSYFQCYITAFIFSISYNPASFKKLVETPLIIAFCLTFTLSIHQLISIYIQGPDNYTPLFSFLTPTEAYSTEHMVKMNYLRRIYWPFPTPHALGYFSAFCSVFFLSLYISRKQLIHFLLTALGFILTTITLSRGPLLALVVATSLLLFVGYNKRAIKIDRSTLFIAVGTVLLALTIISAAWYSLNKLGAEQVMRLTEASGNSLDGHLGIRALAINTFLENDLSGKLIGNGLGSFYSITGTSSSHMSYLTILTDQGLLGLGLFCTLLTYPLIKSLTQIITRKIVPIDIIALFALSTLLILTHAFYNLSNTPIIWLLSAMLAAATKQGLPISKIRKPNKLNP